MFEKIKPSTGRVLVIRDLEEEKTSSGLFMPSTNEPSHAFYTGKIIRLGSPRKNDQGLAIDYDCQVGDRVLYSIYAGTNLDEDYCLLKYEEIIGVL